MRKVVFILLFTIVQISFGQDNAFDKMIDSIVPGKIPYITTEKLQKNFDQFILLDAREITEYEVSHIKGAIPVGYYKFSIKKTTRKLENTNKTVVVYCSIGYRSEKIAEKLTKKGFTVYNLYGGIFDWKNDGYKVFDLNNKTTEKVHCFSQEWGQWLQNGEKIYE